MNPHELLDFLGRHLLLSLALAGITAAIIYTEVMGLMQGFRTLGPAQLTGLINRDEAVVLDLRTANDFQAGHIAGAKNLQAAQLEPSHKWLSGAQAKPVVLICKSGMTATDAARKLAKAGFSQVYVLDGGIGAWQGADLPLVKGRA